MLRSVFQRRLAAVAPTLNQAAALGGYPSSRHTRTAPPKYLHVVLLQSELIRMTSSQLNTTTASVSTLTNAHQPQYNSQDKMKPLLLGRLHLIIYMQVKTGECTLYIVFIIVLFVFSL